MSRSSGSNLLLGLLLTAGFSVVGCSAGPAGDPLQVALSPSRTASQRQAAIGQVSPGDADALFSLIDSARHPMPVRVAAVDRLIATDAPGFWRRVEIGITGIDDWPMIGHLCDRAAADGVGAFLPTAIKSWARPSQIIDDADRPERRAIALLAGDQTPEQLLAAVCRGLPEAGKPLTELEVPRAAWAVLSRVEPEPTLRMLLADAKDDDPLLGPLAKIAPAVDTLPGDREAMLRLSTLIAQSSEAQWSARAAYRQAEREGASPATLAARHLPAIDHAGDRFHHSRQQLLAELQSRLAGRTHYTRGQGVDGVQVVERPEWLTDHAESLGRGDLLVLLQIDEAMGDAVVVAELFDQARADRADTTSEWGGVLVWDEQGGVIARGYPPLMRRHDQIYIASDACVLAMHTGLAHYHFHVQKAANAAWAGPGGGDLKFADALGANCVVLTSVDERTMNVDVYFPGGLIVDLGCITGP